MDKRLKEIECVLTIIFTHAICPNGLSDPNGAYGVEGVVKVVDGAQMIAQEIIKRYEKQLTEIEV